MTSGGVDIEAKWLILYKLDIFMSKVVSLKQGGQTLLIVVLAVVIALTVSLSVASRMITNIKTTTEEANSQKALSAAEAGIERALQKITSTEAPITDNLTYTATVSTLKGSQLLLNGGNIITKDEGVDLWFVEHNSDGTPNYSSSWTGTVTIYWGNTGDNCSTSQISNTMAALEVVVVSGTKETPSVNRYAIDPCDLRRNDYNKFSEEDETGTFSIAGRDFKYRKQISITNGMIARIIPLYANAPIAVVGSVDLPSQGSVINSTGTSGSTERRITVFQGYPSLPAEFFPYNLFYYNSD